MRGKVSIAAISACHFIKAEDFNWSRAVNSQLTVLQWDCGAGGSPDYQSRPSAAGFPVRLPHKALSFIFLSLLPRLSSISGWLWATYCWCVFYSFFFLHIFTDSSHKAPNCSRPRGETRQVLSITSFCVGLRCCGSHPHYHKHSCFTALHKLPLKVVTKYWVNSRKHNGGMTTTWHN